MDPSSHTATERPHEAENAPRAGRAVELLWIGFAIALLAAAVVAWAALRNHAAYLSGIRWVSDTQATIEQIDEARSDSFAALDSLYSYSVSRSEERRVGKECRSRWSPY